jgi:hypothetical protein
VTGGRVAGPTASAPAGQPAKESAGGPRERGEAEAVEDPLGLADVAIERTTALVLGYAEMAEGGRSPSAIADWFDELRTSVEGVNAAVPFGRASPSVASLLRLVLDFRGYERQLAESDPYRASLVALLGAIRTEMRAGPTEDPGVALGQVLDAFEHCTTARLAALLGVRPEKVRRWRRGQASHVEIARILAVAEVVEEMTYNASAPRLFQMLWFFARQEQLGGRRPVEMLDQDAARARPELVAAVRRKALAW